MTFPFRSHFNFPFKLITEDDRKNAKTKDKSETSDEVPRDYKTNDKIAEEERLVTGQIGAAIDMIEARTKFFRSDKEEKIHTERDKH